MSSLDIEQSKKFCDDVHKSSTATLAAGGVGAQKAIAQTMSVDVNSDFAKLVCNRSGSQYSNLQSAIRQSLATQLGLPVAQVSSLDIEQSKKFCDDVRGKAGSASTALAAASALAIGRVRVALVLRLANTQAQLVLQRDSAASAEFERTLSNDLSRALEGAEGINRCRHQVRVDRLHEWLVDYGSTWQQLHEQGLTLVRADLAVRMMGNASTWAPAIWGMRTPPIAIVHPILWSTLRDTGSYEIWGFWFGLQQCGGGIVFRPRKKSTSSKLIFRIP